MFWGWVACNATLAFLYAINAWQTGWGALLYLLLWLLWGGFISAIIIFCAWLVVFLPTDLLVKETSFLREPRWAGPCGALSGFLSTSLPIILSQQGNLMDTLLTLSLPAAVCGLTASLYLVYHHPRIQPDNKLPLTQPAPHEYPHSLL